MTGRHQVTGHLMGMTRPANSWNKKVASASGPLTSAEHVLAYKTISRSLSFLGQCNKASHTGCPQQERLFTPFWKVEVWDQGAGGAGPLRGLWERICSSLSPSSCLFAGHLWCFGACGSITSSLLSSSHGVSVSRVLLYIRTSFNLTNYICNDHICK